MAQVFLGVGSNVGDRLDYLKRALDAIRKIKLSECTSVSSIYETEPVGNREQSRFLNLVLELETQLEPIGLLSALKRIEGALGRSSRERWGPREIDIDVLLYGQIVFKTSLLIIPHPELERRRFVLIPLSEIAPTVVHPTYNRTIAELLQRCTDSSDVEKTNHRLS